MRKIFLMALLIFQIGVFAQNRNSKDNFNVPIREEEGDLNKDGRIDKVIVTMDTIDATVPLRLQVFFFQPNRKYKLVVSSTKIIEAQYPADQKGKHSDNQIPNFFIEDGDLCMISDIKGGQSKHKFRFQNGNFELIHVSKNTWDGKNTTIEAEFNLSTGIRTTKTQLLGSEKIIKKTKAKILVRPLPKLQNFKPFEKEFY